MGKCTDCGKCKEVCPLLDRYDACLCEEEKLEELAYHCFLCGECETCCPQGINGKEKILKIRRRKVREQGGRPGEPGYEKLVDEKVDYRFRNYRHAFGRSVLFPGCNFPSYYPKTTKKLMEFFAEQGMGTVFDCCGKPIFELGLWEDDQKMNRRLETELAARGIEEVVLLCPNCYYHLRDRLPVKVTGIYEKLAQLGMKRKQDQKLRGGGSIFVPCPDKKERQWLQQAEAFLRERAKEVGGVECCGLGGCARAKEPELSAGFAEKLKRQGHERVYTYCASCAGKFVREGCGNIRHILVDLFATGEEPDVIHTIRNREEFSKN